MESKNPERNIIDHQEPYDGKIISVHVDTIRQASGNTTVREVVRHPGGVAAVPILDDSRILLIRQFRYPIGKYIYEIPAGKLDSGQPPLETMKRELEEETGYRAGILDHECSFYTTPGISNELIHLYTARKLTPCDQNLEEGEHITLEALPIEECLQKIKTGEICDGKTVLGLLWHGMQTGLHSLL
jgi:ADP-ribose pyrophosphatase